MDQVRVGGRGTSVGVRHRRHALELTDAGGERAGVEVPHAAKGFDEHIVLLGGARPLVQARVVPKDTLDGWVCAAKGSAIEMRMRG